MPRKKPFGLTNAEHRIMEVIWAKGSATVAEVVDALQGKDAYSTVLTFMRILKAKGFLAARKEGRAFVFTPKVDRETAARRAVDQLLSKFFGGSASELVLTFLREEEITPEELDQLKRKIAETGDSHEERDSERL
jgi:BlaI family transcriptional regulator, penicillinase repressor